MRRRIALWACILALLTMPLAVTAAVVGDGNATMTPGDQAGQMGNQTGNVTIAAYIELDQNLTRLSEAIDVAGFYDTLNSEGPYTLFAPSDDAFDALGNETVNQLLNETGNLTTILQYHIVDGEYTSENITVMAGNQTGGNETEGGILDIFSGLLGDGNETGNVSTLQTLAGEDLNVTVSDGEIMVENATVTMRDIYTTNGVIHIIDRVLVPPGMNLTTGNQTGTPATTPTTTMAENQTMLVGIVQ